MYQVDADDDDKDDGEYGEEAKWYNVHQRWLEHRRPLSGQALRGLLVVSSYV